MTNNGVVIACHAPPARANNCLTCQLIIVPGALSTAPAPPSATITTPKADAAAGASATPPPPPPPVGGLPSAPGTSTSPRFQPGSKVIYSAGGQGGGVKGTVARVISEGGSLEYFQSTFICMHAGEIGQLFMINANSRPSGIPISANRMYAVVCQRLWMTSRSQVGHIKTVLMLMMSNEG